MLVDAGATGSTSTKPNEGRTPGEWVSRYILHLAQTQPAKKLNYVLLTHFHVDHIGAVYPGLKTSKAGDFLLTGITEIAENIAIDKIVDRNWPDYNWPKPLEEENVKSCPCQSQGRKLYDLYPGRLAGKLHNKIHSRPLPVRLNNTTITIPQ
jgi:beta-lactamase superfamily II metal-dependent hydrolase